MTNDGVRYPFLVFGLSCLFCLLFLNFIHISYAFILTAIFFTLVIFFYFIHKNKIFLLSCLSCFLSCVFFTYKFYTKNSVLDFLQEKELTITAHLIDLPEYSNGYCRYSVKVDKIENFDNLPKFKMELISSDDIYCDVFERFKAKIKVRTINLREKIRLKSQGKYLSGSIYSYQTVEKLDQIKNPKYYALKIKEFLIDYTTKIFDSQSERLLRAILFRDRSRMTPEEKNIFSEAGVFHFLAISGFHFSIMIKILSNLFKLLNFNRKFSQILCCMFIVFFIMITGFTPSIARSGIMIFIHILAKLFMKKDDSINSLSLALLIILITNIDSCLDLSLWMSFISSSSLICFSDNLKKIISSKLRIKRSKISNYILSNLSDSFIGTISVFPISCLYFKSFSSLFLISNLLVSFQIYILIIISLLSLAFNEFAFLENLPQISNFVVKYIILIVKKLSKFSFSLDYSFIPLCVSFILIIIAYSTVFRDLKKDFLKIVLMFFTFIELGIISYQIKHINSFQIDIIPSIKSNDLVLSTQKYNFIILQSDDMSKVHQYMKNNKYILNINDKLKYNSSNILKNNNEVKMEDKTNDITISELKLDNKRWIIINIMDKRILVSIDGGDIRHLPKNMRQCDIFVAYKLPNMFDLLRFKTLIYSDNSYLYRQNCNKILNYDNYILAGYNASVFLKDNRYSIFRKV